MGERDMSRLESRGPLRRGGEAEREREAERGETERRGERSSGVLERDRESERERARDGDREGERDGIVGVELGGNGCGVNSLHLREALRWNGAIQDVPHPLRCQAHSAQRTMHELHACTLIVAGLMPIFRFTSSSHCTKDLWDPHCSYGADLSDGLAEYRSIVHEATLGSGHNFNI